jgi:hypothetical protein
VTWWQSALAIWAVGAFAAYPSVYEFNDSIHDGQREPLPALVVLILSLVAAALWPAAWMSLIRFALRKAAGRD